MTDRIYFNDASKATCVVVCAEGAFGDTYPPSRPDVIPLYNRLIAAGVTVTPWSPPAALPSTIQQTDIIAACSDTEAAAIDAAVSQASARLRQMWMVSPGLTQGTATYSAIRAMLATQIAPARVDQLLPPYSTG